MGSGHILGIILKSHQKYFKISLTCFLTPEKGRTPSRFNKKESFHHEGFPYLIHSAKEPQTPTFVNQATFLHYCTIA